MWRDIRVQVLLVAILTSIPLWLIPVAPLSDWPVHIAISREAYLLLTHQISNAYYSVNLYFLGSSAVHLLMLGLQFFVSWEIAAKLALTLLFFTAPVCWWLAFKMLDPAKEKWFVFGTLANYSLFFYWGAVNFLFATSLAFVWIALGIRAFRHKEENVQLFLLLGALVYLCHGYVFFMSAGLLLFVYLYHKIWHHDNPPSFTLAAVSLLACLALLNTLTNPTLPRDQSYYTEVNICAYADAAHTVDPEFKINQHFAVNYLAELLNRVQIFNPFIYLQTVFPLVYVAIMAALLAAGWFFFRSVDSNAGGEPLAGRVLPLLKSQLVFDRFYALLFALLLLHFFILPAFVPRLSGFGDRSLLLAAGFFLLSYQKKENFGRIQQLAVLLVAANVLYQAVSFSSYAPQQASVLSALENVSRQLPAGATVLVLPSNWSYPSIPYGPLNAYYHGLVLVYNPRVYVSGMFLYQETFILRSNFTTLDDFVLWGPKPQEYREEYPKSDINITHCYWPMPGAFDYYLDDRMVLHPNQVATIQTR